MKIWSCKIGELSDEDLKAAYGGGADAPMRLAAYRAYKEVTGREPDFIFSGWGAELTEGERAAHENRLPDAELTELLPSDAVVLLAAIDFSCPGGGQKLREATHRLAALSRKEI